MIILIWWYDNPFSYYDDFFNVILYHFPIQLSDYELCVAANLLDPNSVEVSWGNIGGLEVTIQEIQETVILPFRRADLFRHSSLLQPPKGMWDIRY